MKFEITHHHHYHLDPELERRLRAMERIIDLIAKTQEKIMATLDQVLADVTDESTQIDSLSTLIAGLKQQVANALASATLPADVQAKIDAIFNQAETNKAKIAAAVNANTPAAPPAPVTQ